MAWYEVNAIDPEEEEYYHESRVVAEELPHCLHSVKIQINSILENVGGAKAKVLLTGKGNYRNELVDYYKAHRDHAQRPIHYEAIREYLIDVWGAKVINGREADDALSILQYRNIKKQKEWDKLYGG